MKKIEEDKKKTLKERFEEVKNNILANSKDAHWAKNAIDELVSLKGQLDHEPTLVYLPLKDVERQLKGDTYEMSIMKDGTAVYHTYGGYTVVAKPNLESLAGSIAEYVGSQDIIDTFTEEEKTNFELDLSAFCYIMSLPTFAFSDIEFRYTMASKIVEFLRTKTEELLEQELKEETSEDVENNARFKDATLALEEMKEEMKKAENQ